MVTAARFSANLAARMEFHEVVMRWAKPGLVIAAQLFIAAVRFANLRLNRGLHTQSTLQTVIIGCIGAQPLLALPAKSLLTIAGSMMFTTITTLVARAQMFTTVEAPSRRWLRGSCATIGRHRLITSRPPSLAAGGFIFAQNSTSGWERACRIYRLAWLHPPSGAPTSKQII